MSSVSIQKPPITMEKPQIQLGTDFFDRLYNSIVSAFQQWNSISDKSNYELEIEFRIGRFKGINKDTYKTNFHPQNDYEIFNNLKNLLSAIKKPLETRSTIISKPIQKGQIRKVTTVENKDEKTVYQCKTSLNINQDVLFLNENVEQFTFNHDNVTNLRCSFALEEKEKENMRSLFESVSDDQSIVRERQRFSYIFEDYVIDLTIVDFKEYEIELEFLPNFINSVDLSKLGNKGYVLGQLFMPKLKTLLRYLYPELRKVMQIDLAIPNYLQLLQTSLPKAQNFLNREPKPKNIAIEDVELLYNNYTFTNKLNGVRYRLVFTPVSSTAEQYIGLTSSAFLINNTNIKIVSFASQELANIILKKYDQSPVNKTILDNNMKSIFNLQYTMVDIEVINNSGIIEVHVFDVLVVQNKNVTNLPHDKRMDAFRTALGNFDFNLISYLSIHLKNFFSGQPLVALDATLNYMKEKFGSFVKERNDGIIMIPNNEYYYSHKLPTLKWKYPELVSIDFLIKKIDTITKRGKVYDVFELFVNERNNLVKFGSYQDQNGKYYNPPSVYLASKEQKLSDNLIVEFTFNREQNSFEIHTIRYDKTYPNGLKVARDTFIDMEIEFSIQRLKDELIKVDKKSTSQTGQDVLPEQPRQRLLKPKPLQPSNEPEEKKCLLDFREYHNKVKGALIKKYAQKQVVLDLGAGKGGDLFKYSTANIQHLVAVEPNKEFLYEKDDSLKNRLSKLDSLIPKVTLINTGAEDTKTITNNLLGLQEKSTLTSSQVNLVSSFFSMTFFFNNKERLQNVIKTINSSLKYNGTFIGTTMDGERVYDLLNKSDGKYQDPDNCFTIQRNYNKNLPLEIGLEITINLGTTATVIDKQIEWLVPFNILVEELAKNNIILQNNMYLDNPDISKVLSSDLSRFLSGLVPSSEKLNSLYRYFVFKKIKPEEPEEIIAAKKQKVEEIKKNSLPTLEIDVAQQGNYCKILEEPLYRTGVIGEGSCFYQSILNSMLRKEYVDMSNAKRIKQTKDIRKLLADTLTFEDYASLANGRIGMLYSNIYLAEELQNTLIKNEKSPLISQEKLNEIFASSVNQPNIYQQEKFIHDMLVIAGFKQEKYKKIIDEAFENARLKQLTAFKEKITKYQEFTSHETIEYVMKKLKVNIFIITDSDRLPRQFCDLNLYKPEYPSILILNLEGLTGITSPHYEPLSTFIVKDDKFYKNTFFEWKDPIIQKIYEYLSKN
jgi:hypothetical protein